MILWPYLIVAIIYGACVGSFLNVVVYRMPVGLSLFFPPSRCPKCNTKLAAYDNVPVLGWLWLRGKCRYCKTPISVQYPAIEALTALLFGGLFYLYYFTSMRPDFAALGLADTYIVAIVHGALIAALLAATLIDAKHFIIPISIPHAAIVFALVGLPLATWLAPDVKDELIVKGTAIGNQFTLVPRVSGQYFGVAIGGVLGIGVAMVLVVLRWLPRSFDGPQWDDAMPGTEAAEQQAEQRKADTNASEKPASDRSETAPPQDEAGLKEWLAPPGLKQEIGKEILFCLFPIAGMVLGYFFWMRVSPFSPHVMEPAWLRVLGGVLMGYLVGGGLIWGIRILGTLGFSKEAMGLGDVHLLAAVGAVLGAGDAVLVFFIAPFMGLTYAIVTFGMSLLTKLRTQPIPYGPFLAAGALVLMIFRQPIVAWVLGLFAVG